MQIINGKAIAAGLRAELKAKTQQLAQTGKRPGLAVIIVGDDPASRVYVNNKKRPVPKLAFTRRSTPYRATPQPNSCCC